MNKTIFGIPVILLFFIGSILVPVIAGNIYLSRKIDAQVRVVVPPTVNCVFPTTVPSPTASPSATIKTVPTLRKTVATPTEIIIASPKPSR